MFSSPSNPPPPLGKKNKVTLALFSICEQNEYPVFVGKGEGLPDSGRESEVRRLVRWFYKDWFLRGQGAAVKMFFFPSVSLKKAPPTTNYIFFSSVAQNPPESVAKFTLVFCGVEGWLLMS